jgi:hypothetical protein
VSVKKIPVIFFLGMQFNIYSNKVDSLMEALFQQHDWNEWHLFIDSLRLSLKAVLLQNKNKYLSVPTAHAIYVKKSYDSMHHLLKHNGVQHDKYSWHICGDLNWL